jgi:biopolymer transport protein ExbB/TolQ
MGRGVNSLATIASVAPFVGLFGTVLGIVNSFPAFGTDKLTMLAIITERLSESFVPTELGLLVAVLAFCFYKHLLAKLNDFDVEMENVSLQLRNELVIHLRRP